jgi:glyoxylase-like metal-dependent hydrolase (beta-lactamase superfamily II)
LKLDESRISNPKSEIKDWTRRQLLQGLTGVVLFPRLTMARQSSGGITKLTDALSLVTAGTNVLALSTPDGMVLVDSGASQVSGALLAATSRVRTLFNTHFHLENTGANEALGQGGAKILAHENTRQWMAIPHWVPAEERYEKARPKAAHPTETFYTSGSLKAGNEQIDYGFLIAAHTSGDIYVLFKDANVLAVGDVASPARDPELDYFTGAWIGGRVDAMDRLLKLSDDKTRIVPGYGPVLSRAELKAERDMMAALYERTVDRVREGDSPEDMLKAGVMNGLTRTFHDPKKFLYDVHKGLWAHHNKLAPNVV